MGGTENNEPSPKRLKGLLGISDNSSDNTPNKDPKANSFRDFMARPLPSQGDKGSETIGSKGIINRSEFIKILTKALYSLGYNRTGAQLEKESGICLNSSLVDAFTQQVTNGEWDKSIATLHAIGISDDHIVKSASFLILEQKFLELIQIDDIMGALDTLRNQVEPLGINTIRVHELATCIISSQGNTVSNLRLNVLYELEKLLPPDIMIPERRLETLVEQALDIQRDACVLHNTLNTDLTLYSDHHCGLSQIPSQTLQTLEEHKDEVWFVEFSHNGMYLGSSSKDQSAIIWEVKSTGEIALKHTLIGHEKPVLTVSWSPDDTQILTCGQEEVIILWDVNSGERLHVYQKMGVGLISCGWFPDGKGVFSGMTDKSICLWDLDGEEIECWKGQKTLQISDMAVTDDGRNLIRCKETTILLLHWDQKFERLIEEEQVITSFSLSKDSKFLLVNLVNQEIHLWSIEDELKVVSKYRGHKRSRFIIRSCFGGLEQAFIASGSEDSQVYIWHRLSGKLLLALTGHSGSVNSVSWNPKNPQMFASASDDRTIRIWGLNSQKFKETYKNGITNGGS